MSKRVFHHRCSNYKCQARRALARRVEEYKRVPKCLRCGGQQWWFDKTYKPRRAAATCDCLGNDAPHHRRGWCGVLRNGTFAGTEIRCKHATPYALSMAFPTEQFPDPERAPVGGWIGGEWIPF